MDYLTIKSRSFITILISLSLGYFISIIFSITSTTDHAPQLKQIDNQLQSLEQKISSINDTLDLILEQNKKDDVAIKFDSSEAENITAANLKNILREIIHKELNDDSQQNIASNEDTTRAWELISQAQGTAVTANFFQSKEVNALPAKQKELVISEIIGMMNRGEINADSFFGIE